MDGTRPTKTGDEPPRHDGTGEGATGPGPIVEPTPSAAIARRRALTSRLMEQVVDPDNLNRAYARVVANRGSPGVDGMRVDQLAGWVRQHKQAFIAGLLDGSYEGWACPPNGHGCRP